MLDVHSGTKPIFWPILLWDASEDVGKYYHPTNLAACHTICPHDEQTETGIYAVKYPPFKSSYTLFDFIPLWIICLIESFA